MRKFNLEGPVVSARHYCVNPLDRVDLNQILRLIRELRCLVLCGPRQTGKTSTLIALQDLLNAGGQYRCLHVNVEEAQTARQDVPMGIRTVLAKIGSRARRILSDSFVESTWEGNLDRYGPQVALRETLVRWSASDAKPLVLLIDEIDSLVGDTLISVLRQLRSESDRRPAEFPLCVVLCGVRDLRNLGIYSALDETHVLGGDEFNIKAESLRLGDFSEAETRALLAQHTEETGQQFDEDALQRVWHLTCGQPFLVNALARRACFEDERGRDRTRTIGVEAIDDAKEGMILDRVTHLDQLTDKLREDRVRKVIEPMLAGHSRARWSTRDLEYVRDLGLVAPDAPVRIANPIYAEAVARDLTDALQEELLVQTSWYVRPDGSLDVPKLLESFQCYVRENSDHWPHRFMYKEAGPHLVLQAYLQRVVKGYGRLEREYGLGLGRTDILLLWPESSGPNPAKVSNHVVECKVAGEAHGPETVIQEGLKQTASYMDRCGAESGHLVVFDTRAGQSWEDRIFRREEESGGSTITVWGA